MNTKSKNKIMMAMCIAACMKATTSETDDIQLELGVESYTIPLLRKDSDSDHEALVYDEQDDIPKVIEMAKKGAGYEELNQFIKANNIDPRKVGFLTEGTFSILLPNVAGKVYIFCDYNDDQNESKIRLVKGDKPYPVTLPGAQQYLNPSLFTQDHPKVTALLIANSPAPSRVLEDFLKENGIDLKDLAEFAYNKGLSAYISPDLALLMAKQGVEYKLLEGAIKRFRSDSSLTFKPLEDGYIVLKSSADSYLKEVIAVIGDKVYQDQQNGVRIKPLEDGYIVLKESQYSGFADMTLVVGDKVYSHQEPLRFNPKDLNDKYKLKLLAAAVLTGRDVPVAVLERFMKGNKISKLELETFMSNSLIKVRLWMNGDEIRSVTTVANVLNLVIKELDKQTDRRIMALNEPYIDPSYLSGQTAALKEVTKTFKLNDNEPGIELKLGRTVAVRVTNKGETVALYMPRPVDLSDLSENKLKLLTGLTMAASDSIPLLSNIKSHMNYLKRFMQAHNLTDEALNQFAKATYGMSVRLIRDADGTIEKVITYSEDPFTKRPSAKVVGREKTGFPEKYVNLLKSVSDLDQLPPDQLLATVRRGTMID